MKQNWVLNAVEMYKTPYKALISSSLQGAGIVMNPFSEVPLFCGETRKKPRFLRRKKTLMFMSRTGLEKLTNAKRSISKVNNRLFPVELMEIADWKSRLAYMLHSSYGKNLDKGHRREFSCIYLYTAIPYQVIIS